MVAGPAFVCPQMNSADICRAVTGLVTGIVREHSVNVLSVLSRPYHSTLSDRERAVAGLVTGRVTGLVTGPVTGR